LVQIVNEYRHLLRIMTVQRVVWRPSCFFSQCRNILLLITSGFLYQCVILNIKYQVNIALVYNLYEFIGFLAAILFFSYFYTKTAKSSLPNTRFGFSALKSFGKSCLATFPQKCIRLSHLVEITLHVLGMCKHMALVLGGHLVFI
jgi:hypothetical protein